MTFIISTETLGSAWDNAQNIARQVKATAAAQKSASLAGPVGGSSILGFENQLRSYRTRLDAIAALSGLAAYISGLADTPAGYNVVNEFNAMRTQITATMDWIVTNFPKDGNGFLLERTWGGSGPVERTFTTVQLAGYRTQLDALLSALG